MASRRIPSATPSLTSRPSESGPRWVIRWHIEWEPSNADAFLAPRGPFIDLVVAAIAEVTGRTPELSTSGGTSDARFIKNYCPVLEFGLVGQTMHQVDERVAIADLARLTAIYRNFLDRYFA